MLKKMLSKCNDIIGHKKPKIKPTTRFVLYTDRYDRNRAVKTDDSNTSAGFKCQHTKSHKTI